MEKEKGASGRGAAYPAINLEDAVEQVSALYKKLGRGPYSREQAAIGLGYAGLSGASARAVAALGHYGLLDRTGTGTYSISDLANEIIHPVDESGAQREHALGIAARMPRLFDKIATKFENQSLPLLLENILLREGVNRNSAKEVSDLIKETLQFAGILKNGVVIPLNKGNQSAARLETKHTEKDETNLSVETSVIGMELGTFKAGQTFGVSEAGDGWSISITSQKPLNSTIRKMLVDLIDLLEENSAV